MLSKLNKNHLFHFPFQISSNLYKPITFEKRWAWCFRQDAKLFANWTINALERQNRAFKNQCLKGRNKLPITITVKELLQNYLQKKWQRYFYLFVQQCIEA